MLTALFDLDGTLVDSIDLIWSSYRHTALAHLSRAPDDAFVTYREHNQTHHDAMVKCYPGAVEAVRALKRRGARVGIVTSKVRSSAHRSLIFCGFEGLFDRRPSRRGSHGGGAVGAVPAKLARA